ncbi:hypothetical protein IAT38_005414 [Cryptococcus sp. DSM 104549]
MAPRALPPPLLSLVQSSSYPSLPPLQELESLRSLLTEHSTSLSALSARSAERAAERAAEEARSRKEEKRKRKEREREREEREAREARGREDEDEKARLAVEANEKAGMRLEALERARVQHQKEAGKKKVGASTGGSGAAGGSGVGTASPNGIRIKKERTSLSPAPSNTSSASFRPNHGGPPQTYGGPIKKKKIKRVVDSDDEAIAHSRDRSTTLASPPPHLSHPHGSTTSGLKLKLSTSSSQLKIPRPSVDPSPTPSTSAPANNIDFSLPPAPSRPLVPARAGPRKPMKPGPKKQSEVDEDFSNKKAPNQVAFPTFWSAVEPYLRDVTEGDLAMLGFKADAPEPYDIPPRGRHYTEVWDEEDGNPPGTRPRISVPNLRLQQQLRRAGGSSGGLPLPHFVPAAEMRDEHLADEGKGLGSLTERVVAAVVGSLGLGGKGGEGEGAQLAPVPEEARVEPNKVDVVELEERMKKELKAVMLLGEHEEFDPDPAAREDDEVTSALRQCQRLLSQQTTINDARKARLVEIAKQRLAYSEYTSALDGIEKSIEEGWARRIKKYGISPKKILQQQVPVQSPAVAGASGSGAGQTGAGQAGDASVPGDVSLPSGTNGEAHHVPAAPAATFTYGRPPVPDQMKRLVETRKSWMASVGACMKERPRGELVGIPGKSVYEGIGEESEEKDEKSVEETVGHEAMEVDGASGAGVPGV